MASTSPRFFSPLLLLIAGCAGGGGGGGGGGPVDPPTGPTAFTPQAGLDAVAPAAGEIRVDFTLPPTTDFEVAVFVSTNRNTLFSSTANTPASGATTLNVAGLADGIPHFVGLGIRPTTGGTYVQSGPTLVVTPGAPLYVDAAAPSGGDGLTPGTPFNNMLEAVFTGFASLLTDPTTPVNIWVKAGTYSITSTLPLAAGVQIYGGFGAFDLASRDLENSVTLWNVGAGQQGAQYGDEANTGFAAILDGIRITGNDVGAVGVDTNGTDPSDLELRSVIITDMADRGIRIRGVQDSESKVVMVNCQSSRNGADGLNGNGPFDYSVYNCVFASNVQEGMDLNDLSVETGGSATLRISSSQFFGNGAEGLDCTLGAPLFPTSGAFDVEVRGCAFERNAATGCLIDGDFELVNAYSGSIVVRESLARGNGAHGFHLDLDGPLDGSQRLSSFAYRLLATSNVEHGLYVTSESTPGFLSVSTSAFIGNALAGVHVEGPTASSGNYAVSVSHSYFANNFTAGIVNRDLAGAASSCIFADQLAAFDTNTLSVGNLISSDISSIQFTSAPQEYVQVLSRSGAVLTLAAAPAFPVDSKLELADDGTERAATSLGASSVTLTAAPDDFGTPGLLGVFASSDADVNEDYVLLAGSPALGIGVGGADAGIFGSNAARRAGVTDEEPLELLHVLETTPAISTLVGNNQALVIEFSRSLNGASANASTVRARRNANAITVGGLATVGAQLTITAPGGGWGAGDFRIELDGLTATDGTELSGSVVLPFQR